MTPQLFRRQMQSANPKVRKKAIYVTNRNILYKRLKGFSTLDLLTLHAHWHWKALSSSVPSSVSSAQHSSLSVFLRYIHKIKMGLRGILLRREIFLFGGMCEQRKSLIALYRVI